MWKEEYKMTPKVCTWSARCMMEPFPLIEEEQFDMEIRRQKEREVSVPIPSSSPWASSLRPVVEWPCSYTYGSPLSGLGR